ncbi:hypothetical protein HMP0015_0555 [Acinetobacter haemolyticus ATCC 19194]|uniref:Uncharacterized protein n=1 Tax=Acinetobacter haemolyticus ATCC 19194 TaxID=707232 RepID=D4XLG3_ACIHA|nr:hypothetical protein HMP0015_0555 [Acinetobacter haemolyticus ATCC 19194]
MFNVLSDNNDEKPMKHEPRFLLIRINLCVIQKASRIRLKSYMLIFVVKA